LHKLYGRIAVGIFLVQDLVVVVVLTFLAGLGDTEALDTATVAVDLGLAFLGMGAMLILALVAARYLLVKPMNWVASSAEATLIWSLCWCFAFVVGSEWLNLSPEIGAFLAGLSLAQLPIAHDLRRRVHPLMNFFIAIFFIALGAQMELSAATEHWLAAIIFSLFVIIGNPFIFMIIISRGGYSERTSFMTSVTVAQISEFSFIFAAVGLSAGLIDESILSLITIVGLITIGVSSYMILYNDPLYERVRKLGLLKPFRASQEDDETAEEPLSGHVIVVGMNAMGRRLVNDLYERGKRFWPLIPMPVNWKIYPATNWWATSIIPRSWPTPRWNGPNWLFLHSALKIPTIYWPITAKKRAYRRPFTPLIPLLRMICAGWMLIF
jgi:Kef-type K+ transport system membrane component KefB